jgi:putative ATPase
VSRSVGNAEDLFTAAVNDRLRGQAPLAARLRPKSLDEIVGQQHLVAKGAPLRKLIEADRLSSVILWGPPGTGKTTLAEVVALTTNRAFERLSAVTSGVKDVREAIERATDRLGQHGRSTGSPRHSKMLCCLRLKVESSRSSVQQQKIHILK